MTGNILGYDLNEKNCQISFYSEEQQEPQTMEIVADNYQIPLVLGRKGDVWSFGNDAKRLGVSREGYTVSNLFVKSLLREKVSLGEETYEAVWLLAKFIELSLEKFEQIQQLVFTVPRMSVDIGKILKGIGQRIGVAKSNIYVQDYKESFCNYMLYQPKELWHYEAALFHCDRYESVYASQAPNGHREGCRYICDSGRSGECTDEGTGSGLSGSECGSGKGCR